MKAETEKLKVKFEGKILRLILKRNCLQQEYKQLMLKSLVVCNILGDKYLKKGQQQGKEEAD